MTALPLNGDGITNHLLGLLRGRGIIPDTTPTPAVQRDQWEDNLRGQGIDPDDPNTRAFIEVLESKGMAPTGQLAFDRAVDPSQGSGNTEPRVSSSDQMLIDVCSTLGVPVPHNRRW